MTRAQPTFTGLSNFRILPAVIAVLLGWLLVGIPNSACCAESSVPPNLALTVTNVAQLRALVTRDWRVRCDLQLQGVVCAASTAKQVIIFADASGAELFTLDFSGRELRPGQGVSLTGTGCEVTRGHDGLTLSRAPLVDNDGAHAATGKTASTELTAGWQPLRVEWFNSEGAALLEVSHGAPGEARERIPDAQLDHAVMDGTSGRTFAPGLKFASYEGSWARLPDFGEWPVSARGVATNFDVALRSRRENVGLVFSGGLKVAQSGTHTFGLKSDDGSRLIVGEPLPRIEILATAKLPTLRKYFLGQIVSPSDAYQWSWCQGDVSRAEVRGDGLELELRSRREARVVVRLLDADGLPPALLLKNRIGVSGVTRDVMVASEQRVFGCLTGATSAEVQLVEAAPEVWAANPVRPVSELPAELEEQPEGFVARLSGRLTATNQNKKLVLTDATGSLAVQPSSQARALIGEEVEVLGFCELVNGALEVRAGFFRALPKPATPENKPLPLLTTAEEVLRLKRDEAARGYPVRVRGVITCLWPEYFGNAVLQDATRGVFLRLPGSASQGGPELGDFWEAEGVTASGDFAPIISVKRMVRLSEGRLPEPVRPTWSQLINGSLDAQFVELEGIITRVEGNVATLLTHWGSSDVSVTGRHPLELAQYENMLVRLRGCLLAVWDQASGQVRVGELRLASATVSTDLSVTADPFAAPMKTLGELFRFDAQASAFQRVRVTGQIVSRRDDEFFLMADGGGLRFVSKEAGTLKIGDMVEASGFPQLGGPSPVLREAVARKLDSTALPTAKLLGPGNLLLAENDATRVRVEGSLVSVRGGPGGVTLLEMRAGLRPFSARLNLKPGSVPALRLDSTLELTGVYAGQGNSRITERKMDTFELLVDSPEGVRVVALPAWWTLQRLLAVFGLLVVVLAAAMLWAFQLRRRVDAQTLIIREKVEREATLEERTRIARELHDTLEQALAGVSFQLGAVAGAMRGLPVDALQTLERARLMVKHGQEEARRTVRNLRMFELEVGDLPGALARMAHDAANGMPVKIETAVHGTPAPLPGALENHLLRIGQEAMTNALKHAAAKSIQFDLRYESDAVELKVVDDGRGFDFAQQAPGEAGHFGLLGMRERANKIGAVFKIASQPGRGTTVIVRVPRAKQNSRTETV